MIILADNLRELADSVVYLRSNSNGCDYPTEFQTYEEAWDSLQQSLGHLRGKLGETRYSQLVEMVAVAKAHYDEDHCVRQGVRPSPGSPVSEHIKLGSWLMQDIEQLLKGKQPFAYPENLYRWPRANGG